MAKLISADWLRLSRYWLTWAIAAAWIAMLAAQINGKVARLEELDRRLSQPPGEMTPLEALTWRGDQIEAKMLRENLRYPAFIGYVARQASGIGWFLLIIYTAVMGSENFSRHTLPPILMRGVSRRAYLITQFLSLWLVYGVGLAIICMLAAGSGFAIHSQIVLEPLSFAGAGEALLQVIRAWLAGLPFIALTLIWAVLARSAGPALGVGIGLHFLEYFGAFMLPAFALALTDFINVSGLTRWALRLFSLSPDYNAEVLLNWGLPMMLDLAGEYLLITNPWHSTLLLAIYTLLPLGLALWSLQQRDVAYAC